MPLIEKTRGVFDGVLLIFVPGSDEGSKEVLPGVEILVNNVFGVYGAPYEVWDTNKILLSLKDQGCVNPFTNPLEINYNYYDGLREYYLIFVWDAREEKVFVSHLYAEPLHLRKKIAYYFFFENPSRELDEALLSFLQTQQRYTSNNAPLLVCLRSSYKE